MSRKAAEAERDRILEPINAGLELRPSSMMTLSEFIDTTFLAVKKRRWRQGLNSAKLLGYHQQSLEGLPWVGS